MTSPSPTRLQRLHGVPDGVGWGVGLAFGAAVISGVSIYVNAFAVKQVPDPTLYTTLKNGVAALLLLGALLGSGGSAAVASLTRGQWSRLLLVGVIGGSVPFVLFFGGLAMATAPSAAFIQKTLFVWVALLAVPLLGERLGPAPVAALVVLFLGQALVFAPAGLAFGPGEWMILAATLLWAAETIVVKRLLASVPVAVVAALRLGLGVVILAGVAIGTGKLPLLGQLGFGQWTWVLATGLLLAGYVTAWFGALKRAPASVVTSILVVGAVITGALSALTGVTVPSTGVIGGYVLVLSAAGALALWAARASLGAGRLNLAPRSARVDG